MIEYQKFLVFKIRMPLAPVRFDDWVNCHELREPFQDLGLNRRKKPI